jgi:N-acetylmuramoyl-L-alanine amidase CwlA
MGLVGKSTEEKIWNYLKGRGMNAYGVAGLMGNLYAESGLKSTNLQNAYEKKLGFTDDTYTTSVDNGDYTNFVHDSAGYGLAQWTYYSRKQSLLEYVTSKNKSIGDLETQLEFLCKELSENYKAVFSVLKSASSVKAASDIVLTQYERPADQSDSVKEKRTGYGQKYYDDYAGGNNMAKNLSTGFISDTINGIKVNSSIPCNQGNYESETNRSVAYVVMHYTGNTKDIAKNNANYFASAGRNASAHFFVDDTDIYQSVKLKDKAWHCGTSGTYYHNECRNSNSVGIEMCCTAGNYKVSDTTKKNAAYLCAHICKLLGIAAGGVDTYVVRHYDVTHKNCPAQMAGNNNAEWNSFKEMVKSILNGSQTSGQSDTSSASSSFPATPFTVQVLVSDLNYRSEPSMNGTVKGQTGKGVFTIVEVSDGWGKLKSGAGWIYLENPSYCKVNGSSSTSTSATKTVTKKSNEEIAKEVLAGKWGNGGERKQKLEAAGYNYTQIQALVNKLCK